MSVAVGHAHLAAPSEIHRVEEAVDALGNEVRVIDRERPAEARRLDPAEVLPALLEIVGEIADLGVLRLPVEVLQEQPRAGPLGKRGGALEALDAGGAARGVVAGEVIAPVDDDPLGAETTPEVDVRLEVLLGGVGQERRLGDVDGRRRMQAQVNAVSLARGAKRRLARGRPGGGRVGVGMVRRALEAHVDVVHAVRGRPGEAVLQAPPAS